MSNSIKFNMNNDDIPVIEEITSTSIKESIFSQQYIKAIKEINNFYNEEKLHDVNKEEDFFKSESHNNIFALIGDRGSGKTSCMLSIAKLLCSNDRNLVFDEILTNKNALSNKQFFPLDIIDPSYFDDRHNILAIIIAKIFKKFQESVDSFSVDSVKKAKQRDILSLFSKVQKDFEVLFVNNQASTFSDNVENLVSLSSAVTLKENLGILIKKLLDYLCEKDSTLLIIIDDIDLNTKCADIMMEEIRKYLIQKNILVLISFKIEQLSMVKEQSLIKNYETLITKKGYEGIQESIKQMAETYITKFIPLNNRIYMPDFATNLKLPLMFENEKPENPLTKLSTDQRILTYIYNKTRFLFYNTAKRTNPIIPHNLRQVRQLIKLLWNCEDYESHPDDNDFERKNSNNYNKEIFKKYFFGDWCKRNLTAQYEAFIFKLISIQDSISINYFVIKELKKIYEEEFGKIDRDNDDELYHIFNPNNQDFNISIGDVYAVIFLIEKSNSLEIQNLLFALKTFYSIKLYEFYDKRTEKPLEETTKKSLVIRTVNYLDNITDYEKLVGGSFINTRCIPIAAINRQATNSRVLRSIQLEPLRKKITEFYKKEEPEFTKEDIELFNITEFFILCTSRENNRRHLDKTNLNLEYRTYNVPYYNVSFGSKGTLIFDIGSFLFNVTRLKDCYNRFSGNNKNDKSFYDLAKSFSFSLLNKFREPLEKREKDYCQKSRTKYNSKSLNRNYENRWLSFSSIRNYEILDDIINQLILKRDEDAKSSASDISRLSKIFKLIGSYEKETYSFSEDGEKYYQITFGFAKVIEQLLNDINSKNHDYFNSIYSVQFVFTNRSFINIRNLTFDIFLSKIETTLRELDIPYTKDELIQYLNYQGDQEHFLERAEVNNFIDKLNRFYTFPEE